MARGVIFLNQTGKGKKNAKREEVNIEIHILVID